MTQKKEASPYTDPALRDRLKEQIQQGTKGGKAGQWSARKAQLLVAEYEKAGGGYTSARRTKAQRHLAEWTEQEWTTADGVKAKRPGGTTRYLPKEAWDQLTPAQRQAANATKQAGSRQGEQFVANPPSAAQAAREARKAD